MTDPVLNLVLHQPEIPYNAGAVGRTCVALGAKLWLVRPLGFRIDDRRARRAGLDYWEHLDWEVVDDWESLLQRHPGRKPWLFSKAARRCYTEVDYRPGDLLVFGSETAGLPRSLLEAAADRCLRVPIREQTRSLNLSVTAGIAAFEARRQFVASGLVPPEPVR